MCAEIINSAVKDPHAAAEALIRVANSSVENLDHMKGSHGILHKTYLATMMNMTTSNADIYPGKYSPLPTNLFDWFMQVSSHPQVVWYTFCRILTVIFMLQLTGLIPY